MKLMIAALFAFMFQATDVLLAQYYSPTDPKPVYFSVNVSDLYTSMAWYEKHLNVKPADRSENPELGYNRATLKGEHVIVDLFDRVSADTVFDSRGVSPGISSVGFTISNYEDWMMFVIREKVRVTEVNESNPLNGKRSMTMSDPDGNLIVLMEE